MQLDDCLAQADALIAKHRSFEFYWFPHTDTVLTKAWDMTDEPADAVHWASRASESFLENTVFGALCGLGRRVPSLCPALSRLCASTVSAGRHVDASYAMLSTVRRVRFNEMEWSVPAERGADALREIRSFIARRSFPLMFLLEYRWVRGDDIWLVSGLRPRQRAHLGAPVSRDAVRRVLLGRAGDLPQSRRAAALGQGACDEGRRAGGVLSALGRFPRAARTNGPAWPLPDAVPAHAVRPAATRKRSLSRVRHTGPPRDTPMHETAGIAQDRPRSNQEAS